MWSIHTTHYYSAIERNEILIRGRQKATYYMIPLIWNIQNRPIHRDRKQIRGCQEVQGEGMESVCSGHKGFLIRWYRLLNLDGGNRCTTLWMYLMPLNCILEDGKNCQFRVLCILSQLKTKKIWPLGFCFLSYILRPIVFGTLWEI